MKSTNQPSSETRPVESAIGQKLTAAYHPLRLVIDNQSHNHAGHVGAEEAIKHAAMVAERTANSVSRIRETHFAVTMVAEAFIGQSMLARQRAVMEILKVELAGPVHALSLDLKTPQEQEAQSASNGGH
ncbi:MAG: BolA family protein [Candidatus Pacebacteria bacterium]|nr:BolA family protein [Candidatus Paceibacterota bacterium]